MRSAIIVFPGSNCDQDAAKAITRTSGHKPTMVWHRESELCKVDLVILPGGFAFGDYLRAGAMAARSPILKEIHAHVQNGGFVAGICNGFQVLTETGLLPGVLMRNAGLKFVCKPVDLNVERNDLPFSNRFDTTVPVTIPVAHHDGNYFASDEAIAKLEGEGQVVFRYASNPNGSRNDIAGICNDAGRVLGMMPHPERAMGEAGQRGAGDEFFASILDATG